MVSEIQKPTCRLPRVITSSYLIGNTVAALRQAGKRKEMRKFINEVRRKDIDLNFSSVKEIAEEYVRFYN